MHLSNTDALIEYRCTYQIEMHLSNRDALIEYLSIHLSKIKTKFKYYPLDQTVTLLNLLYDIWLAILMEKDPFFAVTDILIIFSTIAPRCKLRM